MATTQLEGTEPAAEPAAHQALHRELRDAIAGSVRFDPGSRAVYSTDASNYRHVPIGVVQPRTEADVLAAVEICRRRGVPLLPRGAGTSIGGQAINVAVVLDCTRHLNRVLELDPQARTARVQPGIVLDALQAEAAKHGLRFGPDPSTHSRCTLGGMIGNNACGSHSIAWGKTVDNVESLDVVLADGTRLTVGATSEEELERRCAEPGRVGELYRGLRAVRDRYGDLVTEKFPDLTRRVSGYNLDQLLPDRGFNVARALVGTEGTCATILSATVRLVEAPAARGLAVLGFPDAFVAADHVPALRALAPQTIEGIDDGLIAAVKLRDPHHPALASLPPGGGWLFVETGGADQAEADARAREVGSTAETLGATPLVVTDATQRALLWRIREEGAGTATRLADGGEAWPGWEDSAVPPDRLGSYLRGFQELMDTHGRRGVYYGHFGDGCIHVRIDFDMLTRDGVADFRTFMEEAADLVTAHGGSLSGEHGDGQARAELLDRMYPPEILRAFADFKAAWDPDGRMNPNRIVEPAKLDEDLRVFLGTPDVRPRTNLAFSHDDGDFRAASRRCMGVGKCLSESGGVMCPSYRATHEEKHSTRGRARLLFEMANGGLVKGGWRSEEVRDALDLCLSCKGCKTDCPVNVDMATYKAEFLSHHYAGRLRPASHYSMGFLPLWLRMGSPAAPVANPLLRSRALSSVVKRVGGLAPERSIPPLATRSLLRRLRGQGDRRSRGGRGGAGLPADAPRVLLWPDTFTNFFDPEIGLDAVSVLESLGYRVEVPPRPVCCGLTWVSTGQLGMARRVVRRTLRTIQPWLDAGVPVVGMEPSCTALLRGELTDLLPDSEAAARLRDQTRTFAELLDDHGELGPVCRAGQRAMVQVHCHQHADLGYDADRAVLDRLGVEADVLDSGCCGLAGNFGFEKGHYEVSQACAERALLPSVRDAESDVAVLADGFSCRTQVRQAGLREPVHLAQLAARALDVGSGGTGSSGTGSGRSDTRTR